jgi:hypothetical protein
VRSGCGLWTRDNETGLFAVRQASSRFRFRSRNLPVPSAKLCAGRGSRRFLLEAGLDVALLAA